MERKTIDMADKNALILFKNDGANHLSSSTSKTEAYAHLAGRNFFLKCLCLFITLLTMSTTKAQTILNQSTSTYEVQVKKFKPEQGLTARNSNDVRLFIYDWFTHFEHGLPVDFYLSHLDEKSLTISFPGQAPLNSHSAFDTWYTNLLNQTHWNFHDLSNIQIKRTSPQEYLVSFIVDWYGEVKSSSNQLAGWQSRKDSYLYHYTLRQTWTVREFNTKFLIQKLLVTSGDTPSPIIE